MICDERNFINKLRNRQERAMDYIVEQYMPVVKGAVHKVLLPFGQRELEEECMNDVFLSVWRHMDQFHGNDALEFKKWIYKIAKYKAIDYYRKKMRLQEVSLEAVPEAGGVSVEDVVLEMEEKEEFMLLLEQLEPTDRKIFIMKYLLGERSEEIASRLGITRAAVDNRIYRSKQKLGKRLEAIS